MKPIRCWSRAALRFDHLEGRDCPALLGNLLATPTAVLPLADVPVVNQVVSAAPLTSVVQDLTTAPATTAPVAPATAAAAAPVLGVNLDVNLPGLATTSLGVSVAPSAGLLPVAVNLDAQAGAGNLLTTDVNSTLGGSNLLDAGVNVSAPRTSTNVALGGPDSAMISTPVGTVGAAVPPAVGVPTPPPVLPPVTIPLTPPITPPVIPEPVMTPPIISQPVPAPVPAPETLPTTSTPPARTATVPPPGGSSVTPTAPPTTGGVLAAPVVSGPAAASGPEQSVVGPTAAVAAPASVAADVGQFALLPSAANGLVGMQMTAAASDTGIFPAIGTDVVVLTPGAAFSDSGANEEADAEGVVPGVLMPYITDEEPAPGGTTVVAATAAVAPEQALAVPPGDPSAAETALQNLLHRADGLVRDATATGWRGWGLSLGLCVLTLGAGAWAWHGVRRRRSAADELLTRSRWDPRLHGLAGKI